MQHSRSQRGLQERFGTRRLADRPAETAGDGLTPFRAFIEARDMFFIVDVDGQPQRSYKGGDPLTATIPGALLVVRVRAQAVFPNCGRDVRERTVKGHVGSSFAKLGSRDCDDVDLGIGGAAGDQPKHLDLALAERGRCDVSVGPGTR